MKYTEERCKPYFVFGMHPNGMVDIATVDDDTVATVSREHAEKLIADRDYAIEIIDRLANALFALDPSAYHTAWYVD